MFENWLVVYLPLWKIWVTVYIYIFSMFIHIPIFQVVSGHFIHIPFVSISMCMTAYVLQHASWAEMLTGLNHPIPGKGRSHRHGLFPLKSLLSSKPVPQRLQYLLMAAWFPIWWGCRGAYHPCMIKLKLWYSLIIFQMVIIYQWKNYGNQNNDHH